MFDEVQHWYVVFTPRTTPRRLFWHFLTDFDFSHAYLVRELPDATAMVINPLRWGIAVHMTGRPIDEYIIETANNSTAVLGYTADYRTCSSAYVPRLAYSCVSIIKAILGIRSLCLRPRALYKLLLKSELITPIKIHDPDDITRNLCRHCGSRLRW